MVYEPAKGVTAERSGDRVIVLDASGQTLSTLSPVGAWLWERLPAGSTTLLEQLCEEFPSVDRATLSRDVEDFLTELCDAGLAVHTDAAG